MNDLVSKCANLYEQERAARIKRNRAVLHDLGLSTNLIDEASAKRDVRSRKQAAAAKRAAAAAEAAPKRRSCRLQGGSAPPLDPTSGAGEEESDEGVEGQRRKRTARGAVSARLAAATDHAGLTEHNLHRVRTMTDKALQTRIWKIQRVDKLRSFIQVLEACGKEELAAEAAGALQEMSAGIIPRLH